MWGKQTHRVSPQYLADAFDYAATLCIRTTVFLSLAARGRRERVVTNCEIETHFGANTQHTYFNNVSCAHGTYYNLIIINYNNAVVIM